MVYNVRKETPNTSSNVLDDQYPIIMDYFKPEYLQIIKESRNERIAYLKLLYRITTIITGNPLEAQPDIQKLSFAFGVEKELADLNNETDPKSFLWLRNEMSSHSLVATKWNEHLIVHSLLILKDLYSVETFNRPSSILEQILELSKLQINQLCMLTNNLKVGLYEEVFAILKLNKWQSLEPFIDYFRTVKFDIDYPVQKYLVIGTMSAGKSTFLNSIVGRDFFPSKNEACTSIVFEYDCNLKANRYIYRVNHQGQYKVRLHLSEENFQEWNQHDEIESVYIQGSISKYYYVDRHFSFLDTPGPNNSVNGNHRQVMEQAMETHHYKKILYILNATQLATDDDRHLLIFLKDLLKRNPDKEINFIVNKTDEIDSTETENVSQFRNHVIAYLTENGFENPKIFFVSSLAAKLAIKVLDGQTLTRREKNVYTSFVEFLTDDLSQYATINPDYQYVEMESFTEDAFRILYYSGIQQVLNNI